MSNLLTGTVTFLFTDIEGSTNLWQQSPNTMPDALACHHAILRDAFTFGRAGKSCLRFRLPNSYLPSFALNAQKPSRPFSQRMRSSASSPTSQEQINSSPRLYTVADCASWNVCACV